MDPQQLRNILESCLLVAGKAMSIAQLELLFEEDIDRPERSEIKQALSDLQNEYEGRGIELVEVSSGWRLQSSKSMEHWVGRLFQEKQPRYSRALLETLVLIAYRQPITRGEIEDVRGVAVSSNIIRTLQEREWIKEMGYKDVPGKPALWGTTREFLDYFNLKRLDELPTLAEARDLAEIDAALAAEVGIVDGVTDGVAANDDAPGEGDTAQADTTDDNEAGVGESDTGASDASASDASASDASESQNSDFGVLEGSDENTGLEAAATDSDAGNGKEFKVDDSETHSDDPGSELINLAANLGKERIPEPGLGELVDSFDADADADAEADGQLNGTSGEGLPDSDRALVDETADDASAASIDSDDQKFPGSELDADQSEEDQAGYSAPPEAMEISAHEMDIEEWKEPASKPSASDKRDEVAQAQSDLRRVIDDFAEEHRIQLDADAEHQQKQASDSENTPQTPSAKLVDIEQEEPVTSDGDDSGVLRTKLYGIRGAVESELDPTDDSGSEVNPDLRTGSDPSDRYTDSAKGEP